MIFITPVTQWSREKTKLVFAQKEGVSEKRRGGVGGDGAVCVREGGGVRRLYRDHSCADL